MNKDILLPASIIMAYVVMVAIIFVGLQKPTYEAEKDMIKNQREILNRLDVIDNRYQVMIDEEKKTQQLFQEDFEKKYNLNSN